MKKTRILLVSLAILFISVVSPYVAATDTPYNEIEENVAEITGDTTEKINDHLTINYDEPFTVGDGSGAMPLSLTNTALYGADIAAGIYRIKNEFSDMYIDIHGPSSSGLIHQWTFSTSSSELWYIEPYVLDTEYYIIQSMHYDLAFMGTFGFATNTDNVALNTIADPDGIMHSDSTLWKIYSTNDGRLVLFPKANHSSIICLAAPSDDVGDELVQSSYYESDSQFWTLERYDGAYDGIVHTLEHVASETFAKPQISSPMSNVATTSMNQSNDSFLWKFEYNGYGYYKIKNDSTGYYLFIQNLNDGEAIIQEEYSPALSSAFGDQFLWHISKQSDGTYKIQNKSQLGTTRYVTVVNDQLVSKSETNGINWNIKPLKMNVNVLYDQAFVDRYGSSYMTVLNNVFGNTSQGYSIAGIMKDRFGIIFEVSYTTTPFVSMPYVENCEHKNSIDTYCFDCKDQSSIIDDGTNTNYKLVQDCKNGLHHKEEGLFLDNINSEVIYFSSQENVLFTGHVSCGVNDAGVHDDSRVGGIANPYLSRAVVMSEVFDSELKLDENYDPIINVTLHEMLHTLGVQHCVDGDCLMVNPWSDGASTIYMCGVCTAEFNEARLRLYNHQ